MSGLHGLAIASDLGIAVQTVALAVMLHRRRLVSLAHLEFGELARALVASVAGGLAAHFTVASMPATRTHTADVLTIAAGSSAWLFAALAALIATRSHLPRQLLRRKAA